MDQSSQGPVILDGCLYQKRMLELTTMESSSRYISHIQLRSKLVSADEMKCPTSATLSMKPCHIEDIDHNSSKSWANS
ncbi:hypothetical protein J6590_003617 [Homalodisca vitripennis]|nr:hypothetical protein J6590_003617 [Homalodisca vitripennis]